MATVSDTPQATDMAILARVFRPDAGALSAEAAESLLALQFPKPDLDRLQLLTEKNKTGLISDAEGVEIENYRRVGYILELIHSRARRSLQLLRADC